MISDVGPRGEILAVITGGDELPVGPQLVGDIACVTGTYASCASMIANGISIYEEIEDSDCKTKGD